MGNDRAEPGEQGTPEGSTLEEVHLAQFEYFDLIVERRLRDLRHMRRKSSRTKGFASYVFGMCNGMGSRKSARRAGSALTLEWSRRGAAIAVEAAIHDRGPAGERVEVSRVGVGGAHGVGDILPGARRRGRTSGFPQYAGAGTEKKSTT